MYLRNDNTLSVMQGAKERIISNKIEFFQQNTLKEELIINDIHQHLLNVDLNTDK